MAKEIMPDIEEIDIEIEQDLQPQEAQRDRFGFLLSELPTIANNLVQNVLDVERDEQILRKKWIKYRKQMDAVPSPRSRNSPLQNSSNVCPPLAQIHGNGIAANLINYFSTEPFWNVKSLKKSDEAFDTANFLTKYLDMLCKSPHDLDIVSKLRTIGNETGIMGRCVVKVPYTVLQHRFRQESGANDDFNRSDSVVTVTTHNGPELIPIPQEDIYYPKEWNNIADMPWIGHLFRLPEHVLLARQADGIYENVDDVINNDKSGSTPEQMASDIQNGRNGAERKKVYELIEFYFYHDADGDGYVEDHIWTIDRQTGTILRKEYNTLGERPFEFLFFQEKPHEKSGRGTGQICEPLQDELEGLHNTRNDNMKIANMRMFAMKRSCVTANGEELFPGKIWTTDNPGEIVPLQLGEVYPSSLSEIQNIWQTAAQATGLSEVSRGFADPTLGQRDTFRGQQMRMNASKGLFGVIADGMSRGFNRIGMLILYQLIANADKVLERERQLERLTEDEQIQLAGILNTAVDEIPARFAFYVKTGDADAQQGAQLQAIQAVVQMYSMWAQQSTPLAMQLFGPQGEQIKQQAPAAYDHMLSVYVGSTKLLERMMQLSGIADSSRFTPSIQGFELLLKMMDDMQEKQVKEAENAAGIRRDAAGSPAGLAGQVQPEMQTFGPISGQQGMASTPRGTNGQAQRLSAPAGVGNGAGGPVQATGEGNGFA